MKEALQANPIHVEVLEPLIRLITTPKRIKIVVGGRGSGKSTGVGDIMLMFADQGERILCAREFQNSIDDSCHQSLKDGILRLDAENFSIQSTKINNISGGEIFYKGLARNITSVKSISGINRLWIEEGESISENSLRILTPSIRSAAHANTERSKPPEIWITMNRASTNDAIAKKYLKRAELALQNDGFYEDDLLLVVQVNWRDNPFFPPELDLERLDDLENLPRALYRHIWEGEYNDTVDSAIIPVEWFEASIDAHVKLGFKPEGVIVASHDPSDLGPDAKGFALRHGSVFLDICDNPTGDANEGLDWAIDKTLLYGADWFVWDADGLGVSLKRQVDHALEGKKVDYFLFKGSETAEDPDLVYCPVSSTDKTKNRTNKETFANKRAQFYWKLRDRFYNTYRAVEFDEYKNPDELISISSSIGQIEQIRAEICRIPQKRNNNGKIQLVSKVDMVKKPYELPSPNMADSMAMAMFAPKPDNTPMVIDFDGWRQ